MRSESGACEVRERERVRESEREVRERESVCVCVRVRRCSSTFLPQNRSEVKKERSDGKRQEE